MNFGRTIPLKIPSQHFLLPLVTQQIYYEIEKRESQKIGPSASLLLHCPNIFFCYPDRCQHRKQRFISCPITSRSCCHLLLWGFCCCHENEETATHTCSQSSALNEFQRVCCCHFSVRLSAGKKKKKHLFSQKTGLSLKPKKPSLAVSLQGICHAQLEISCPL